MTIWQDARFAVRLLTRNRWFAFVAAVTLGCGAGASTTAFTVVNALTRGLPIDQPDRIVQVGPQSAANKPLRLSARELDEWRSATTLVGVGASSPAIVAVGAEGRSPEPFTGSFVSANAFDLLNERPMLGRQFQPDDDRPGARPVMILGGSIWRTRFDSDPNIVGRTLTLNNAPAVVVGVMRDGFRFPMVADVWMPAAAMPGFGTDQNARNFDGFARLTPGATLAQAKAELDSLVAHSEQDVAAPLRAAGVNVTPYTGDDRSLYPFFAALMGSVAFVLLIGCVNVANLLFARSVQRSRDTAIHLAHGASRSRILRQVVIEGVILATVVSALGFAIALLSMKLLANSLVGINFPYRLRWTMDGRVYGFCIVVSIGAAVMTTLWPAVVVTKTGVSNITETLKDGGRSAIGSRLIGRLSSMFLAGEVAFTLVLLTGAGLMIRSFTSVDRADRVVDASKIVATRIALSTRDMPEHFFSELQERVKAIPTVAATTMASAVPFVGAQRRDITIDGRTASVDRRPSVSWVSIGPAYFDTLGIPLRRGRVFTDRDGTAGNETAIVNERFASMYVPGDDPIGKRIVPASANGQPPALPLTIVGISPAVRQQPTLSMNELDPVVYIPRTMTPGPVAWLMVRSTGDVSTIVPLIREQIFQMAPQFALGRIVSLDDTLSQSRWTVRVFASMMGVFAWIAIVLAAVGLYAVTASTVAQRKSEIGVRMALGAQRNDVLWFFIRRALLPISIGLVIGLAGALAAAPLLKSFLVLTSPNDPVTLFCTVLGLAVVAIAATALPARRASILDPLQTLRRS